MPATMTEANAVAGFLPSSHGLHFANRYAPGPTVRLGLLDPRLVGVGDAKDGLCGGMSWFVRERFEAGQPIPADTAAPDNGSPLFRAIVRRQVQSLDWLRGPLRFWLAAGMSPDRLRQQTLEREWPRIRASIDGGRIAMVGLVRHRGWNPFALSSDHTVLAFGYETAGPNGPTTIRLYDPNWPNRDDVTLTLMSAGFLQSTAEPLFGLIALG
jgi:hypothetical protein